MARYLALLGSINVGGNRVTMAELREALEREEIEDVETVVASGNILFSYDERPSDGLAEMLAWIVRDRFDIDTFAAVRTRDELKAAIDGNPFAADGEENQVHTLFLDRPLDREAFDRFAASYAGPERIAPGEREIFVDFREGVGSSRLMQAMARTKLFDFRSTARNLRSLRRMLQKMED